MLTSHIKKAWTLEANQVDTPQEVNKAQQTYVEVETEAGPPRKQLSRQHVVLE